MGILADRLKHHRDLIVRSPVGATPVAPLRSVHASKIAIGLGPLVPNRYAVRAQGSGVRVAGQEPQQLVHDGFKMDLFGREERETRAQVKARLRSEHRNGPHAGAVGAGPAMLQHVTKEAVIFEHRACGVVGSGS